MSPPPVFSFAHKNSPTGGDDQGAYQKGVKYLCDQNSPAGFARIPNKYVWPVSDRPNSAAGGAEAVLVDDFPVIDYAQLQGPNRSQVLQSLSKACEEYGFFQLINHGISREVIHKMMAASRTFFELPYEERAKFMSSDMTSRVRYGTSFNQTKDRVFSWRDFLKLTSPAELPDSASFWPSSPADFREAVVDYSKETKFLYTMIMEAILESLGLLDEDTMMIREANDDLTKEFEDGSQMMVLNYYPSCPEPDLTLGMPPHSDYGLLTLVLQDEVNGLQIQHQGRWLHVQPVAPYSFIVNVGDHLEIFSNGKYKSVLHRVLVNSLSSRISVASLHSMPFDRLIQPSAKLINEANPKFYKDTNFTDFLDFISSCEPKCKNFLESRKLL